MLQAIRALKPLEDTFAILGRGPGLGERTIVLVENGRYIGWGVLEEDCEVHSFEDLRDRAGNKEVHQDCNWIIQQYLRSHGDRQLLKFDRAESASFDV